MLNYEKWKLLNETLVPINLGFRPSHSLGITGAHLGQNTEETIEEEHDMDEVDFEAEDDMGDEVEEDMEFDGEDEDMEDGEESEMEMDAEEEDEDEDEDEDDEYSGGCPAAKMSSEDEDEESEDEHEHENEGEDMDFEFESTNNQSKTWWESVAGMVGTKGQYKNARELTEAVAKETIDAAKNKKVAKEDKPKLVARGEQALAALERILGDSFSGNRDALLNTLDSLVDKVIAKLMKVGTSESALLKHFKQMLDKKFNEVKKG
jgi:hypothetical protein